MVDVAESNGHHIDAGKLAEALGVPVLPMVASTGRACRTSSVPSISALQDRPSEPRRAASASCRAVSEQEADGLAELLAGTFHERRAQATAEALLILSNEKALASSSHHYPADDSARPWPQRDNGSKPRAWTGAARPSKGATHGVPQSSRP